MEYHKNIEKMKNIFIQKTEEKKNIFHKVSKFHTYIDMISRTLFQKQQLLLTQKVELRSLKMDPFKKIQTLNLHLQVQFIVFHSINFAFFTNQSFKEEFQSIFNEKMEDFEMVPSTFKTYFNQFDTNDIKKSKYYISKELFESIFKFEKKNLFKPQSQIYEINR